MPARRYDALSGRVGCCFVHALATEITGFWQHHWNTERFIVLQTVILQRARNMTRSGAIQRRIDCRLDAREVGEFEILAEDTARNCMQYISISRGEDTPEHWAKIYHSLVLWGKLCSAVRWIADKDKGGVFQPGDI